VPVSGQFALATRVPARNAEAVRTNLIQHEVFAAVLRFPFGAGSVYGRESWSNNWDPRYGSTPD